MSGGGLSRSMVARILPAARAAGDEAATDGRLVIGAIIIPLSVM